MGKERRAVSGEDPLAGGPKGRRQTELAPPVDEAEGKSAKQQAREHYKMLGNKKEKGKTQKGGDNHWKADAREDALGGGW